MTSVTTVAHADELPRVALLTAQLDTLAAILEGAPLQEALESLLRVVETVSTDGVLGSVLLLDADGAHLLHGAAPSLPATYNEAIHGVAIGPSVGSCGTAAYRREQVIVEDIERDPLWADFRDLARAAGLRACWSTPIVGLDGTLLGTFAMYYPQPQRPGADDLALIALLVRTVAMAIERSRADAEREDALATEREAALTLQHSLLSEVPPRIGRVHIDGRYRTGDPGVEVGGDWFDAVAVEEGLVVVVGDVQGHDLNAAALMGQLRTVVRAYAAEGHPPASILTRAGDYLNRLGTDRLATVLVVHLDTDAGVATVASAGHLPPLLLAPGDDGWTSRDIDVAVGAPLGIGSAWPERSSVLPNGGILLLYTDGLVETRAWDLDEGLRLLHAALASLGPQATPADVLDAAVELVPTGLRGDDVAALAVAIPAALPADTRMTHRWLPAQPMSAPLARSWAEGLLRGWGLDESLVRSCALVLSELVTNAVRVNDDAIRASLSVGDGDETVLVEVFDRSHRLPHLRDGTVEDTDGRGLGIVARVAADWGVREQLEGKTVWARVAKMGA